MKKTIWFKFAFLIGVSYLLLSLQGLAQIETTGELGKWTSTKVGRQSDALSIQGKKDGTYLLKNVRAARNEGFDRVVFEFADNLSPYNVKFTAPPFNLDESDKIVKVAGKSFLEVTFTPARGFDFETGNRITTYQKGKLKLPVVQETAFIYDHEGMVMFIVGLKKDKEFRVTELQNPTRLVIDFKH